MAGGEERRRRPRLPGGASGRLVPSGRESRRAEAAEEVASSAPPPGPRWAPLLAWALLSLNPQKVKNRSQPRRPLRLVGRSPAFLRFLEPQMRTPLERTVRRVSGGAPTKVALAPILELSLRTSQARSAPQNRTVLCVEGRQLDGEGLACP